jgi:hypothetical protein
MPTVTASDMRGRSPRRSEAAGRPENHEFKALRNSLRGRATIARLAHRTDDHPIIRFQEHSMSAAHFIALASILPFAACASQVDGDNQGTPLATFRGSVSSERTETPTAADVAVIWRNWSGPALIGGGIQPVEGSFPSEFKLSMYEPPTADVVNMDDGGVEFSVAYIEAVEPGQTEFLWPAPQSLGMDFDHLLVHVPADVPAGSFVAKLLHSTPTAGFHLYGVHHLTPDEKSARASCIYNGPASPTTLPEIYDRCGGLDVVAVDFVPLPADLDAPLAVKLVDEQVLLTNAPNWW